MHACQPVANFSNCADWPQRKKSYNFLTVYKWDRYLINERNVSWCVFSPRPILLHYNRHTWVRYRVCVSVSLSKWEIKWCLTHMKNDLLHIGYDAKSRRHAWLIWNFIPTVLYSDRNSNCCYLIDWNETHAVQNNLHRLAHMSSVHIAMPYDYKNCLKICIRKIKSVNEQRS